MTGALAAEGRTDMGGRPGINPLRFETEYVLDEARLAALKEIDQALGTAAITEHRKQFGIQPAERSDIYPFLKAHFVQGDAPGIRTKAKERDLTEITRWVAEARQQADLVVVSLHCHEGQNTDSNSAEPSVAADRHPARRL